jgi:hypothetical protein
MVTTVLRGCAERDNETEKQLIHLPPNRYIIQVQAKLDNSQNHLALTLHSTIIEYNHEPADTQPDSIFAIFFLCQGMVLHLGLQAVKNFNFTYTHVLASDLFSRDCAASTREIYAPIGRALPNLFISPTAPYLARSTVSYSPPHNTHKSSPPIQTPAPSPYDHMETTDPVQSPPYYGRRLLTRVSNDPIIQGVSERISDQHRPELDWRRVSDLEPVDVDT